MEQIDKYRDLYIETLQELVRNVGLRGALLSELDGIAIASALREGIEADRIAVMSAAAFTLGSNMAKEINNGALEQIIVKSDCGLVVISAIFDQAILAAVADENVKLGFLLIEMKKARSRLMEVMPLL